MALGCGVAATPALANLSDLSVSATVYGAGSQTSTRSITLSQLQASCNQYSPPDGSAYETPGFGSPTWALGDVLGCMGGVNSNPTMSVVVDRSDGGTEAPLSGADLEPSSSTFEGHDVPLVSQDGEHVLYFRPARNSADDPVADEVVAAPALQLQVFEGGALTVVPQASATTIPVGGTVTFSPNVTGATNYDWNFGQVAPDSSAANPPPVTFTAGGKYPVTLEAWNPGTGAGGSGTVTISVNSPTTPPTTTGTTPNNANGTNTNPAAPNNGPTTGSHKTNPASPSTHPHTQQHSNSNQGKKTPQNKTSSRPTQTTTQPTSTTPTTGSSGGSGTNNTGSGQSSPSTTSPATSPTSAPAHLKPHPSSPSTTTPLAPEPPSPSAPVVTGRLISDVILLPASSSPLVTAEPGAATQTAMRQGVRASVLPILAGVAAVLLLLGLGAARELRGRRALRFGS